MKLPPLADFLEQARRRDAGQPEFLQAVGGVMDSLWPFIAAHPAYGESGLLERLIEPERVIQFRVAWTDDSGAVRVNRAWRVQHSAAIGPYKGGMRFGPAVNLSVLKFLAFEQTFKNALTTLPLGGGKGGADFDPKGRSAAECMRFCQALVAELFRHIGADTDVPAGDMGVSARELGYMTGMMRKLSNSSACTFTGKGLSYGGSPMRPQATGYGLLYFVQEMLARSGRSIEGMRVAVSGSGNVALYAVEKALALGARVLTVSDSGGTVVDPEGFTPEKLAVLQSIKSQAGRVADYAARMRLHFESGKSPWHVPAEVALPCAVENELDEIAARLLVKNGLSCVAEGANMPCTPQAIAVFQAASILYAPGKASNAGGVAVSGLEMSQNAVRLSWTAAEVEHRLREIMVRIHADCAQAGRRADGSVSYVDGANIAGFVKVADAMLAQGVT